MRGEERRNRVGAIPYSTQYTVQYSTLNKARRGKDSEDGLVCLSLWDGKQKFSRAMNGKGEKEELGFILGSTRYVQYSSTVRSTVLSVENSTNGNVLQTCTAVTFSQASDVINKPNHETKAVKPITRKFAKSFILFFLCIGETIGIAVVTSIRELLSTQEKYEWHFYGLVP